MKLTSSFFQNKTTQQIAKELLGKILTYQTKDGIIKGIINETEAYTQEDEASHTYNGKKTKRNQAMFKKAGHIYIYFTYGMYHCLNIVTGEENKGEAVLIRSILPLEGIEIMKKNRNKQETKNLTNGPAKLCMAYNLNKDQNGIDILKENSKIYLENSNLKPKNLKQTKRIGISKATELELRFVCQEFE